MNLPDITQELASALRDVIQETPESSVEDAPEAVYEDLASRLILRLSKRLLTVAPVHHTAAARIFDIFTRWMKTDPSRVYLTRTDDGSKFELLTMSPKGLHELFRGESIQDAYAQAAQAIHLNEEL